ncbi:hypothetical protein MLD38_034631 [Melastoma candidum]|uniref:Uncharacterized protein n=1 Tax=Melastoma candidum TaxID=119954 RepID=A0ACB9ME33_9MYRT|nr:hypothetical protein MLD38_034631 [Melastoma candidum]
MVVRPSDSKFGNFSKSWENASGPLWVVTPGLEVSAGSCLGLVDTVSCKGRHPPTPLVLGFGFVARNGVNRGMSSWLAGQKHRVPRSRVRSSLVVNLTVAGDLAVSAEEKVYNVVLKQAALVNRQLRSKVDLEVKPEIIVPGSLGVLGEAYERCGEICAEYA